MVFYMLVVIVSAVGGSIGYTLTWFLFGALCRLINHDYSVPLFWWKMFK